MINTIENIKNTEIETKTACNNISQNDMINMLHNKFIIDKKNEPKEGQRDLLCSNNESMRCPSLCVNNTQELTKEQIIFLESFFRNIIRIEIEKYE